MTLQLTEWVNPFVYLFLLNGCIDKKFGQHSQLMN